MPRVAELDTICQVPLTDFQIKQGIELILHTKGFMTRYDKPVHTDLDKLIAGARLAYMS
jgi:hypothetical protein